MREIEIIFTLQDFNSSSKTEVNLSTDRQKWNYNGYVMSLITDWPVYH